MLLGCTVVVAVVLLIPAARYRESPAALAPVKGLISQVSTHCHFSDSFLLHSVLFGIQTFLFALVLRSFRIPAFRAVLISAGTALVYSTLIECLQQLFVAGRAFEWSDMAANVLGIICGGLLALIGLNWCGWKRASILKCED